MHSLRSKILVCAIAPLAITLAVVGCIAVYDKNESERELTSNRLDTYRSLLETGDLSFESLEEVEKLEELLNETVIYAEILKKDFTLLYRTKNTLASTRDEDDSAIMAETFAGVQTVQQKEEDGEMLLEYFSPLIIDGKVVASLRLELSYEKTNSRVFKYALLVAAIALSALLICYAFISFLIGATVIRNISKLKSAALQIEKGDFDTEVVSHGKDEIGDLAKTLERMRKEVKDSRINLQLINQQLEKQVAVRTTELSSKLDELKHLNSFMVDRELKMLELKKRIEELEKGKN